MYISDLFQTRRPVFSFEVFPPKANGTIDTIYHTLEQLIDLKPDFISVTYGAGGNAGDTSTCDIAAAIQNRYQTVPLAHLTCVNYNKTEIDRILDRLGENGIKNILALRGDLNPNIPPKKQFAYASELVEYIHVRGGFHISGACYPESHVSAENIDQDILHLKKKVDAGASHLISQLFFDNQFYYSFLEKAKAAGIVVPIQAGIMPVVNKAQIMKMVTLCGASLPAPLVKILQKHENSPEELRDAGIDYAISQILDLLEHGVDGIHLYTMNQPAIARRIREGIAEKLKESSTNGV